MSHADAIAAMQAAAQSGSDSDEEAHFVPAGIDIRPQLNSILAIGRSKPLPPPPKAPARTVPGSGVAPSPQQRLVEVEATVPRRRMSSISLMAFLANEDESSEDNEMEKTLWDVVPSAEEAATVKSLNDTVSSFNQTQNAPPSSSSSSSTASTPTRTPHSSGGLILPAHLGDSLEEEDENISGSTLSSASFIEFLREGPQQPKGRPAQQKIERKPSDRQNRTSQMSFLEFLSEEPPEESKDKKGLFKTLLGSKSKKVEPKSESKVQLSASTPAAPQPLPHPTPAPTPVPTSAPVSTGGTSSVGGMSLLDFLASEPPAATANKKPLAKKPTVNAVKRDTAPEPAPGGGQAMSLLDFLAKTEPTAPAKRPHTKTASTSTPSAPPVHKEMSLVDFLNTEPPKSPPVPAVKASGSTPRPGSARASPSTRSAAGSTSAKEDDEADPKEVAGVPMVPEGFVEASVVEIVQKLVQSDAGETSDLTFVLLVNFESSCNAEQLMSIILDQYKGAPGNDINQDRALDIIAAWMSLQTTIFNRHREALIAVMKKYSLDTGINDRYSCGMRLRRLITDTEKGPFPSAREKEPHFDDSTAPVPILPIVSKGRFGALHIHPLELARQMTLIDQDLWRAIEPWEFHKQAWNKPEKQRLAPNIFNAIVRFNVTSRWIQAELLCEEDLKTRVLTLKHFLKVAAHLIELNNFNGLLQITSAIMATPVYRLKKTFEGLTEREQSAFAKAMEIVDAEGNYKRLRNVLKSVDPPALPYLGMYLTEMIYAEEGTYTKAGEGKVSVKKWARLANIVRKVQKYQKARYNFVNLPLINDLILNAEVYDDDVHYKLSIYIEPRNGGEPTGDKPPQLRHTEAPKVEAKGLSSMFKRGKEKSKSSVREKLPTLLSSPSSGNLPTSNAVTSSASAPAEEAVASITPAPMAVNRNITSPFKCDSEWAPKYPVVLTRDWPFDPADEPTKIKLGPSGEILGATLTKLVERLTLFSPGSSLIQEFISTFTSYTTARELFDLLTKRFSVPPLRRGTPATSEASFQMTVVVPIRLRVIEIFLAWLQLYPLDLKAPSPLSSPFATFLSLAAVPALGTEIVSPVMDLMEAKDLYPFDGSRLPTLGQIPNKAIKDLSVLDFSPEEIARQLSLEDRACLIQIRSSDLSSKVNVMESSTYSAPVKALIARSQALKDLVKRELNEADVQLTSKVLSHWSNVVAKLKAWNNWQSLYAICNALGPFLDKNGLWTPNAEPVRQLVRSFYPHTLADYSLDKLKVDLEGAMKNAPGVPYLTPLLVEIQMVEVILIPDEYLDEPQKLINFERLKAIAALLSTFILLQQKTPYRFIPVPVIQQWLMTFNSGSSATVTSTPATPAASTAASTSPALPPRRNTPSRQPFTIGNRELNSKGSTGSLPVNTHAPLTSHPSAPALVQHSKAAAAPNPTLPTTTSPPLSKSNPALQTQQPPQLAVAAPALAGVGAGSSSSSEVAVPAIKILSTEDLWRKSRSVANVLIAGWGGVGRTTLLTKLSGAKLKVGASQLAEESEPFQHANVSMRLISPVMSQQSTSSVIANLEALHGCLLVYDVSKAPSANGLFNWWKGANVGKIPTILVGTHADCPRQIPAGAVSSFAAAQGMKCLEISSLNDEHLTSLLVMLSELMAPLLSHPSNPNSVPGTPKDAETPRSYPEAPRDAATWNAIVDYLRALEQLARNSGAPLPPRPPGL